MLGSVLGASAQTARKPAGATTASTAAALQQIGRTATAAEVKAWDIDVRADFKGLPTGAGSVAQGEKLWDAQCASCHGTFGESNEVFTPIVGGTTAKDIETGRVQNLLPGRFPHRTTLMKASQLSTLWDYIHRAMPWTTPKSLKADEVYAVLAYILHLGDIVPADFTLSDRNMAEVQARLPNRNGKVFYAAMWDVRGKGDVVNPLCMTDCPIEGEVASALPDFARNTHGNIAEQVRPFGAPRGTDTAAPPRSARAGTAGAAAATAATAATATAAVAAAGRTDGAALVKANGCTACHGMGNRIVGPAFQEIAKRHAGKFDSVEYLAGKIRSGGQGAWGAVPMPPQAQVREADARAMAQWLVGGAP
ncbi:MAG: cytochrome C [Methylibium sp. NZG]|nr:MAG: cytochrome C [Methylibium sp. NZG]